MRLVLQLQKFLQAAGQLVQVGEFSSQPASARAAKASHWSTAHTHARAVQQEAPSAPHPAVQAYNVRPDSSGQLTPPVPCLFNRTSVGLGLA